MQDLAAQLGVARGTVRTAYEKLDAAQLIVASRATGTRVAPRPRAVVKSEQRPDPGSFLEIYQEMTQGPAFFQMGVPATETFPATLFARIRANAVRAEASAAPIYPDPRGELELRREIAGYLAIARAAARAVFEERELVDLTIAISLMNAYNRMAISFRNTPQAALGK